MNFPNKLRDIRKRLDIKATELAELLEITFQHYYAIERGQRQLSATHLNKLTNFLNVTSDEILGAQPAPESLENKKIPKDLKKILEEKTLMFDGELMNDDDKNLIEQMLTKMYYKSKEQNKRK